MNDETSTSAVTNSKRPHTLRYVILGVLAVIVVAIIAYVIYAYFVLSFLMFAIKGDRSDYKTPRNLVVTEDAYHLDLYGHFFVVPQEYMKRYGTSL